MSAEAHRIGLLPEFLHRGILDLHRDELATRPPHQAVALAVHDAADVFCRQLRESRTEARDDLLQRSALTCCVHAPTLRHVRVGAEKRTVNFR